MTECVKITYDRDTQELNFETVSGPDAGVPVAKTITIGTGEWEFEEGIYFAGAPLSVVQVGGAVVEAPALFLSLPNRFDIAEGRALHDLGVGVGCVLPEEEDGELEFIRWAGWTGWVTADVSSEFDFGEILADMRDDSDAGSVLGRRLSVEHPDDGSRAPPNTTVILRLYERWAPPPPRGRFWTAVKGSREMSA